MHAPQRVSDPVVPLAYTISDTARLLSYSVRTVYRLIDKGELRIVGQGKLLRVLAISIEEYLYKRS